MFEELANCPDKVVGRKQVVRAIRAGALKCIFVAQDADESIRRELLECSAEADVRHIMVPTKKELGLLCGISVSAACAGIPNEKRSPAGCQEI